MDKMKLGEKMLCVCALAAATVLSAFADECVVLRPGEVEVVLPAKPLPIERFANSRTSYRASLALPCPL